MIARFADACSADERIVAAFLGGSVARGGSDEYSDVDLCVITTDEAIDDTVADRASLVRRLGEPLFLDDFGDPRNVFFILADGTEGEILFFAEGELDRVDAGRFRSLVDEWDILPREEFPEPLPDPADQIEELRRVLTWFWHDLSHFTTAIGRGQLWWAVGQLEILRACCVNLVRIERGLEAHDEPYEKLDGEIPPGDLEALRSTFVPPERAALLEAAGRILAFYRALAPDVAEAHALAYPTELDRLMGARLERLRDASG
ncbi:MAG TPA: nucleotidyltransferase domain-containing protein [Actinomycetota bacterium]|nr:nucleotidyltransferase domain-containing protein [Actinomycetota bacterium]